MTTALCTEINLIKLYICHNADKTDANQIKLQSPKTKIPETYTNIQTTNNFA